MLGASGCRPRRRGRIVRDVSDLETDSTGEAVTGEGRLQVARELGRSWWAFLVLGIVWVLFGMFVLSYRVGSLLALAVLAGVVFILSGVAELGAASRATSWRWLYVASGVLSVIAGVIAFIWPGITLFVLSVVLSWFLVVMGVIHVVGALAGPSATGGGPPCCSAPQNSCSARGRPATQGGYPGRSLLVFVNLVGIYALIHGFTEIFGAFTLRELARHPDRASAA
jgi:uncharacterized membrane protein HdeD (DUF308 family)